MNQSILSRFNNVKFVYLDEITIDVSIYTEILNLTNLIKLLNYFHISMIFNHLEFEMPFVFNYHSRQSFKNNFKYLHSISFSLIQSDKLTSKLLTTLYSQNKSSAKFLYDLNQNKHKRNYQSSKMKRKSTPEHTLILFNNENMDETNLPQLAHLLG